MYPINETVKMVAEQGQNVIACAKELEQISLKTGKERSDLFERYCANQHSFNVYTYMNSTIENLTEVHVFQRKIALFGTVFVGTRTDYEAEVDALQAKTTYEELVASLHEMINALQFFKKTQV
ncbi:hypothetical protein [Psychrobacillus sp. OK032]|uniref:hypothetical protein n=1 Tax=Psychrobacillus sp. OK032 TaxID=1884358 RepID=UPI0008B2B977|nr:hypothetical protein [Psychrobacillus sp. OK032]SES12043.1 hypothetical protein SAMN05518872_104306 [Psychrobacillus sp. OK032]